MFFSSSFFIHILLVWSNCCTCRAERTSRLARSWQKAYLVHDRWLDYLEYHTLHVYGALLCRCGLHWFAVFSASWVLLLCSVSSSESLESVQLAWFSCVVTGGLGVGGLGVGGLTATGVGCSIGRKLQDNNRLRWILRLLRPYSGITSYSGRLSSFFLTIWTLSSQCARSFPGPPRSLRFHTSTLSPGWKVVVLTSWS